MLTAGTEKKPPKPSRPTAEDDPSGKDKSKKIRILEDSSSLFHWNRRSRLKWTGVLFFGSIFIYSVRSSMSICVSAIGKELGWNKQVSGLAMSSFFAGYVTTNTLGGYLADRYGGEKVIMYGGLVWSTMTLAIPMAARYPSFLFASNTFGVVVARFLTGVGQGMHFPSFTSIIAKRNPVTERALIFSFSLSGTAMGTIFSGLIGSMLLEYFGWPSVFVLIGFLSLSWLLFLRKLANTREGKDRVLAQSQVKINNAVTPREPVPWCKMFSRAPVWALLVVYFCNNMAFYNLLSWLPVYFNEQFPESKGWIFNVVPWISNFLVANVTGYFANALIREGFSITFVRKLCTSVALGGAGTFLLLLNLAETFRQSLFLLSVIIGLMAVGNCGPLQNSQDLAPKHTGALYGTMNTVGAFSGIIGVYLTGYILETIGKWSVVFSLTSGACFTGFIAFLIFGSGEKIV